MANPATAVRGTTIKFSRVFRDAGGNIFIPSSVVLTVRYATGPNVWKTHDFQMVYDTIVGEWWALWDTSGAYPCTATWSMYAPNDEPPGSRYDGATVLTANPANPQSDVDTPDVPPSETLDLSNPNNSGLAFMLGVL